MKKRSGIIIRIICIVAELFQFRTVGGKWWEGFGKGRGEKIGEMGVVVWSWRKFKVKENGVVLG